MKNTYTGMMNTSVNRLAMSQINFIKRAVLAKCHLDPNQASMMRGFPKVNVRVLTMSRIGVHSPYIMKRKRPSE